MFLLLFFQILFCRLTDYQRDLYQDYIHSPEVESIMRGRTQVSEGGESGEGRREIIRRERERAEGREGGREGGGEGGREGGREGRREIREGGRSRKRWYNFNMCTCCCRYSLL